MSLDSGGKESVGAVFRREGAEVTFRVEQVFAHGVLQQMGSERGCSGDARAVLSISQDLADHGFVLFRLE